jgi:hypothetical protein
MDPDFNDKDQNDSPISSVTDHLEIVGSLLYVLKTRQDIAYAVQRLASRSQFHTKKDFDAAIREWEAKPAAMQTYANLKVVMCAEFSKLHRQDSTTARASGHASVNNVVEEMAQATEELVAELTERHSKQVEALIKANSEAMEKLTSAILANKPTATGATVHNANHNNATNSAATAARAAKAAAWAEKKKTATTCPHCNKVHPNRTHDLCWELPANAAKRPANWTSAKST